ncbi:MAG: nitrate- and nitrite sensing domain-containing protein [Pirellulales bacterium]
MKISGKLFFLTGVPLTLALTLFFMMVKQSWQSLQSKDLSDKLHECIQLSTDVIRKLQAERNLCAASVSRDIRELTPKLVEVFKDSDEASRKFYNVSAKQQHELELPIAQFRKSLQLLTELRQDVLKPESDVNVTLSSYNHFIEILLNDLEGFIDSSRDTEIIHEFESISYLLRAIELLDQERGQVAFALSKGNLGSVNFDQWSRWIITQTIHLEDAFTESSDPQTRLELRAIPRGEQFTILNELRDKLRQAPFTDDLQINLETWFRSATNVLQQLIEVRDRSASRVIPRLVQQYASQRNNLIFRIACMLILCLTVASMTTYVARRHFIQPLTQLTRVARDVAEGRMDTQLLRRRRDEIGDLINGFDSVRKY